MRISGVRCEKCKKEASHVYWPGEPTWEEVMRKQEDDLRDKHLLTCKGPVVRFEEES